MFFAIVQPVLRFVLRTCWNLAVLVVCAAALSFFGFLLGGDGERIFSYALGGALLLTGFLEGRYWVQEWAIRRALRARAKWSRNHVS